MTLLDQDLQAPPVPHRYRGVAIAVAVLLIAVLALGAYLFRLKHRAEQTHAHISETQPVVPPVTGPLQQIAIFVPSDSDGTLHPQEVSTAMPAERSERARQALHALIVACTASGSAHPLPPGADVKTVYLLGDNMAVLDLNSAFVDSHRSGILVEELTIASIVHTLAANVPGITRVKFLVEGKERDTLAGHADLKTYYGLSDLAAFAPSRATTSSGKQQ